MKEKAQEQIVTLIGKAGEAKDSSDALRFSQAALNIANALTTVRNDERTNS